jgi:hypothetical protein
VSNNCQYWMYECDHQGVTNMCIRYTYVSIGRTNVAKREHFCLRVDQRDVGLLRGG